MPPPALDLNKHCFTARRLQQRQQSSSPAWTLENLAGQFVALDRSGIPLAVRLMMQAQKKSEPAAWITERHQIPFAPDLAANGLDLNALPFVRARSAAQAWKTAATLLRSGAFSLVVLTPSPHWRLQPNEQILLARHAREHSGTLLFLGHAEGPQVGLKARSRLEQTGFNRFQHSIRAEKSRVQPPPAPEVQILSGPEGLG